LAILLEGTQIVQLLQPARVVAPQSGRIVDSDRPGTSVHSPPLIKPDCILNGAIDLQTMASKELTAAPTLWKITV